MSRQLNLEQLKEIIPHRPPFLLIDYIEHLEEGKRAVGTKYLSENEWFFNGHFPNNPIMPGVIIIEAMAQVGCVAILSMPEYKHRTALFGGIKNAKFKKIVLPNKILKMDVSLLKIKGTAGLGKGTAYIDDKIVCECEFLFMIQQQLIEK